MSRCFRLVIAAAVVLIAGCSGLPIEAGESTPDREPYAVDDPLEPRESDSEELIPGVSVNGVEDEETLLETYREALQERSHTIDGESRFTNADGTETATSTRHVEYDPDANARHRVETWEGGTWWDEHGLVDPELAVREQWNDDSRSLVRNEYENGSVEYSYPQFPIVVGPQLNDIQPPSILSFGGEFDVYSHEADGERYYVLRSTEPADAFDPDESFTADLFVREDGLVTEWTVEGTIHLGDETVRVDQRTVVSDVGETTLEEPDWTDEARDEADGGGW